MVVPAHRLTGAHFYILVHLVECSLRICGGTARQRQRQRRRENKPVHCYDHCITVDVFWGRLERVSQPAELARSHARVLFECFNGRVHFFQVGFGLCLIAGIARLVQVLRKL